MNIKLQIRNIIFENLNSENTSTEYHTKHKFDIPRVDTENQIGLTSELIVILGVIATILSLIILYCIFRLKRSLICCLIQIRNFYEFTSFMYSFLTCKKISSNENSEPGPFFIHLSSQNSKVSPSCTSVHSTYPEFRSTITHTSNHTSSSSESELELQRTQPTYPEYRSMITQTSDLTSSSSGSEMELRRFMINSEVVYGYLKLPPPEFRTARPKLERKRLSDRHSI